MICFTIQDGMRFRSNVRSMGLKCDGIVEKRMGVKKEGMEMNTKSIYRAFCMYIRKWKEANSAASRNRLI